MVILGEWSESRYQGKIKAHEPLNYKVIKTFPTPFIAISFYISVDSGKRPTPGIPQKNDDVNYNLMDLRASLNFSGIPLGRNSDLFISAKPQMSQQISFLFTLNPSDIAYIESKRVNDLNLEVLVQSRVMPYIIGRQQNLPEEDLFSLPFLWKFSQAEWTKFLSELGYSEKWIIEIDRPKLEGFHEVLEHLEKAQQALFNKSDPEDVIRDLRAAKDSFASYYNEKKEKIIEFIDRGSLGEPKHENKSERIDNMYDKISDFLNIGPHNNVYKVTYQDSQLAFREFVSILSYISYVITEIQKEEQNKGWIK